MAGRGTLVSTVIAAALGLLITATGSLMVWRADHQQNRERIDHGAINRVHTLRQSLDETRGFLAELTEQLRAADAHAADWTKENPTLFARHLPWIKRVAWVESAEVPESAGHLLGRARDTGSLIASAPLPRLRDHRPEETRGQTRVLVAVPAYLRSTSGNDLPALASEPDGYWLAEVGTGGLLQNESPVASREGALVRLIDETNPADPILLQEWPPTKTSEARFDADDLQLSHEASISFGGRTLSLQTYHTGRYLSSLQSGTPWIILVGGLLLITLLVAPALIRARSFDQEGAMLDETRRCLEESNARFGAIVDSMADWVWEIDAEGRYTYSSTRVEEILGYAPKEILGKSPFDIMPAQEAKRVGSLFQEIASEQKPFRNLENWNLSKNGQLVCLLTSGHPVYDDSGAFCGYRGVDTEITDRVRVAADFAEALAQLRSILDAATEVGIIATDVDGKITAFNTGAERMLGYQAEEIVEVKQMRDLFREEEVAARGQTLNGELGYCVEGFDALVACARSGGSDTAEWSLLRRDATLLTVNITFTATYDDAGSLTGFLAIAQDITERKRWEDELRRLGRAVEQASDGIAITDLEGYIEFVNPGWVEMHGVQADKILGEHIKMFHTPEQYDTELSPFIEDIRDSGSRQGEIAHLRVDGSTFPAWTSCTILGDDTGLPMGFVHVVSDISNRKATEEALRRANEEAEIVNLELERSVEHANRLALEAEIASAAKSEFLANMSHEIRTPMNGILGMSSLLLDTELSAEQQDNVQTVRSCAESLLTIINDILDFSKIEAGKMDLEMLDFDLRTTCDDMNIMVALRALEKGLEYVFRVDPETPSLLRGDPGRLRQILLNLVGNAIKFTSKGEVVVQVALMEETDEDAVVRFRVSDTGIGISKDKAQSLFAPFTQADASTTRIFGGTGLGLTISKRLVEMMDGEIGVESEKGQGSTFWFTLHLKKQMGVHDALLDTDTDLRGKRILVVDGHQTSRDYLRDLIKTWDCEYVEAEGDEILHAMEQAAEQGRPVDVAVLDLAAASSSCVGICSAIRDDDRYGKPILVALTSVGHRGDAARLEKAGFSVYLTKPVSAQQLRDCLIAAIGQTDADGRPQGGSMVTRHSVAEAYKRRVRILLAEDNVVNRTVAMKMVEKLGYRAEPVWNGAEAVAALEETDYDLVLMDIQMPEMDGFEATKRVRAGKGKILNPQVPIIAMTAHAMKGDREKCLERGMDDYVSKPIQAPVLAEVLARWLEPRLRELSRARAARKEAAGDPKPNPVVPLPLGDSFAEDAIATRFGRDCDVVSGELREYLEDLDRLLEQAHEALDRHELNQLMKVSDAIADHATQIGAHQLQTVARQLDRPSSDDPDAHLRWWNLLRRTADELGLELEDSNLLRRAG